MRTLRALLLGFCAAITCWSSLSHCRTIRPIDLDDFYHEISYLLTGQQEERDLPPFPQPVEVTGWPQHPLNLGQITGIAVNKQNNLVAFHRGNNIWDYNSFNETDHYQEIKEGPISVDTIVTLDKTTGKVLSKWGKNKFYLPHGLTMDKDENIWVTDVALHQVFKFPAGSDEPSLVLGEAFIPGNDEKHFCKPTDVAVASTGEFFISDGYCNSRIQKYSAQGNLLMEWGYHNGHRDFLVPHSITLLEEQDLLCVADRENKRVMCYSAGLSNLPAGKLIFQIHNKKLGRVFAVGGNGQTVYAVTGPTARLYPIGVTIDVKSQEIVNSWRPSTGFMQPHDIAVSPNGTTLYVAEIGPNKITKFYIQQ